MAGCEVETRRSSTDLIPINGYTPVNICDKEVYGIEWILSRRRSDYGWADSTHRAVTSIFTSIFENETAVGTLEKELMANQLQVELSKALARNTTEHPISASELALYVNAQLAVGRNPRNFAGKIDLVAELLKLVDEQLMLTHPFITLSLCNAHALKDCHLTMIRHYLSNGMQTSKIDIETTAIALKTFACAAYDKKLIEKYQDKMHEAAISLAKQQKQDGSFGNVITTALVLQALKSMNVDNYWSKEDAVSFLRTRERQNIDVISIYYLQMALRTRTNFIREMTSDYDSRFPSLEELKNRERSNYVIYSLKVGKSPEIFHTLYIHVPFNITVFDVMRIAEDENPRFGFSYNINNDGDLDVYSIGGLPNNAEDGIYWRLFQDLKTHSKEITEAVSKVRTEKHGIYIFQYMDLFTQRDAD